MRYAEGEPRKDALGLKRPFCWELKPEAKGASPIKNRKDGHLSREALRGQPSAIGPPPSRCESFLKARLYPSHLTLSLNGEM